MQSSIFRSFEFPKFPLNVDCWSLNCFFYFQKWSQNFSEQLRSIKFSRSWFVNKKWFWLPMQTISSFTFIVSLKLFHKMLKIKGKYILPTLITLGLISIGWLMFEQDTSNENFFESASRILNALRIIQIWFWKEVFLVFATILCYDFTAIRKWVEKTWKWG